MPTILGIAQGIVGGLGPAAFRVGIGGSIVKSVTEIASLYGMVPTMRGLHSVLRDTLGVHVSRNTVNTVMRSVLNIAEGHRFSAAEVAETIDKVPPMRDIIGVTWRQTEPYGYTMEMTPIYPDGTRGDGIMVTTTYPNRVTWHQALEDAEENFGKRYLDEKGTRDWTLTGVERYEFEPRFILHRIQAEDVGE